MGRLTGVRRRQRAWENNVSPLWHSILTALPLPTHSNVSDPRYRNSNVFAPFLRCGCCTPVSRPAICTWSWMLKSVYMGLKIMFEMKRKSYPSWCDVDDSKRPPTHLSIICCRNSFALFLLFMFHHHKTLINTLIACQGQRSFINISAVYTSCAVK